MDQSSAPPWDPGDWRDVLRAALDRHIPADDFPGALAAGVERSLARQLAGDAGPRAPLITDGLQALNDEARHRFGIPFAALDSARQDELLAAVELGAVRTAWSVSSVAFFTALLELTNESYYGSPGSGLPDPVSWRMTGYRPGPRTAREQV
jgi:hypothetical protein